MLVALGVLLGGGYAVYAIGLSTLKAQFAPPPDYTGNGTGSVVVQVRQGDAASDIGNTLVAAHVVKSQEAFADAADADPDSRGIQVGFYQMKHKMSAQAALAILVDPANMMQDTVAIPEGWTVRQIVAQLARDTRFSRAQFEKVLRRPDAIGLPSYAGGKPEGYLFPATYEIPPDATPQSINKIMVDRFDEAATKSGLQKYARRVGYSPHDVMTVASLVQAEARFDKDFPKVARVIYNRLHEKMKLQFDSTVHYAVGKDGSVGTSARDRASSSPFNTYRRKGLPPTPIASPGDKALRAALHPAHGSWLYFVTTNPDTGVTKFATSYKKHLRNKAEFDRWCARSDHC